MTPRREARVDPVPGPGAYGAATTPRASLGRFNIQQRAKELRESLLEPGCLEVVVRGDGAPAYAPAYGRSPAHSPARSPGRTPQVPHAPQATLREPPAPFVN